MPPTTSREQQDLGGRITSTCVPQVHPLHGTRSALRSVSIIPKGLMDRKREEFCNLTQGRRSVDEYSREFNWLARYATEEVSTDAKKQERFRRGLNTALRRELNLHDFASFQVLVN